MKRRMDISRRCTSHGIGACVITLCLFALVLSTQSALAQEYRPVLNQSRFGDIRIDSLYGSRDIVVGEDENYRVRLAADAVWPIIYEWDMGDGVKSAGNNVVHHYTRPGYYTLRAVARNRYDADSTYIVIRVRPKSAADGRVVIPAPEARADARPTATRLRSQASAAGETANSSEYYAWLIETHFSDAGAQAALKSYREKGIGSARVYVDRAGAGSVAYRVIVGSYFSTQSAVADREGIEAKAGRTVSMLAIR